MDFPRESLSTASKIPQETLRFGTSFGSEVRNSAHVQGFLKKRVRFQRMSMDRECTSFKAQLVMWLSCR